MKKVITKNDTGFAVFPSAEIWIPKPFDGERYEIWLGGGAVTGDSEWGNPKVMEPILLKNKHSKDGLFEDDRKGESKFIENCRVAVNMLGKWLVDVETGECLYDKDKNTLEGETFHKTKQEAMDASVKRHIGDRFD
jgi:hypothetical protein